MCSLSVNVIFVILSYSCIATCKSEFGLEESVSHRSNKPGHRHCYVKLPLTGSELMPIPFEGNFSERNDIIYESHRNLITPLSNPKVIRPDENGYLFFKHNNTYKMGCAEENEFLSPTPYPVSEVTVKCVDGSFKYAGKMYEFDKFRCAEIPKAKLLGTEIFCNKKEYSEIKKIGFQSRDTFLNLYRMCFDNKLNYTYYAWYYVNSSMYERYQISKVKLNFIQTRETCNIDVNEAYENLTKILKKSIKAEDLLDEYREKNKKQRFIKLVHLIGEHEFVYAFEQQAAYLYENMAIQWLTFNSEVWNDFEKSFRRSLTKIRGRHLIVVGTFFAKSRLGLYDSRDKIVRFSPNNIGVPEYFWKMDYNVDTKYGVVYIGVNKPRTRVNDGNVYICDTIPCPGRGLSRLDERTELFYCCSKESFEKVYGDFDSDVYKQFYFS